jgi:hypothetical protein
MMDKYYVQIAGGNRLCVLAESEEDAAVKFVKRFGVDFDAGVVIVDKKGYIVKNNSTFLNMLRILILSEGYNTLKLGYDYE